MVQDTEISGQTRSQFITLWVSDTQQSLRRHKGPLARFLSLLARVPPVFEYSTFTAKITAFGLTTPDTQLDLEEIRYMLQTPEHLMISYPVSIKHIEITSAKPELSLATWYR